MRKSTCLLIWLWAAAVLAGCQEPTVTIEHVLPGPLDPPVDSLRADGSRFEIQGQGQGDLGDYLANSLNQQAGQSWRPSPGREAIARAGRIGGTIYVQAKQSSGSRAVLGISQTQPRELPTASQRVHVRVVFVLSDEAGQKLLTYETNQRYDSAGDPRTRGELGLKRADDPANLLPLDGIVHELLDESGRSFIQALAPTVDREHIQLRSAVGTGGVFRAAKQGQLAEALQQMRGVAAKHPGAAADFDLAVLAEATGNLNEALEAYKRAAKTNGPTDAQAGRGVTRVEQVIARSSVAD